jgi:hypothetical protein
MIILRTPHNIIYILMSIEFVFSGKDEKLKKKDFNRRTKLFFSMEICAFEYPVG